jgi:hypothetical protein
MPYLIILDAHVLQAQNKSAKTADSKKRFKFVSLNISYIKICLKLKFLDLAEVYTSCYASTFSTMNRIPEVLER